MNLGGAVPRYLAILVAMVLGLSLFSTAALAQTAADGSACPPPQGQEDAFPDDDGNIHEDNINCAAAYDITQGFPDGTYKPGRSITRAQMATFIVNFLTVAGADLPEGSPDAFPDDDNSVHEGNINILADTGIVRGFADGTYRPEAPVSREQMATYIAGAIEYDMQEAMPAGDDAFTDDEASVHESNINKLAEAEVVQGTGGTNYSPRQDVTRAQMASFIMQAADYLDAHGEWAPTAGASLALASNTAEAGDPITGVVSGDVTGVSVSGCGLTNQALTDKDAAAEGFQFDVTIPSSQPAGDCELTFTITQEDGDTITVTRTITVTQPAAGAGATEQPELVSAEIIEVDTGGTDAGVTVRYTFDEAVELAPSPALFHVVEFDGSRYDGTDFVGSTATDDDNVVDVFFLGESAGGVAGAPDSQAEADDLSVATVDFAAVQDFDNEDNPEGDAALGDSGGGSTPLPAGVTAAPDLTGVDVQNEIGTNDTRYEVVFTFDETVENAFAGLALILEDGTQIDCTPDDPTPDDTTVETECDAASATDQNGGAVAGYDFVPGDVSRGIADTGSVDDGTNSNPLQAAEGEGDEGNTDLPDLVSAQFFPGSSSTSVDRVAYTFDEPVDDTPNCALFYVYEQDTDETTATDCERDSARVIVAEFDPGILGFDALEDAVGASVDQGAVQEDSVDNRNNQEDEVGVQNTATEAGAGFTDGPDLTEVNVEVDTTVTGTAQGIVATYTFDEDVDDVVQDENRFFLYDVAGNRYMAENCEATDDTDPGEDATVECTDFFDTNGASMDDDDEEDLVEDATLGTVDDGAVMDEDDAIDNPEGAEPVTA